MNSAKKLLCLVAAAISISCGAQNISALWKKVDDAVAKDLPKTVIAELRNIYRQASASGKTGEMLKAAIYTHTLQTEISPDSALATLSQIDSIANRERRPAERALWHLVAAHGYADSQDDGQQSKCLEHIAEAVKDFSIFDNRKASEFMPPIIKGKDSRYFKGDLLNVVCRDAANILDRVYSVRDSAVAMRRSIRHRIADHYRRAGNYDATILCTLDSLGDESGNYFSGEYTDTLKSNYTTAISLARQYSSSPCAVEALIYLCERMKEGKCATEDLRYSLAKSGIAKYASNPRTAELRNIIKEMKARRCEAHFSTSLAYTGERIKGSIDVDNIANPGVQLFRTPYTTAEVKKNPTLLRKFKPDAKTALQAYSNTVKPAKEYFHFTDSFICTAPAQPGIYIARIKGESNSDKYQRLYVSNLRTLFYQLPERRTRIAVVDARSGKPVAGAKVNEFVYDNGTSKLSTTYTADSKGEVTVAYRNSATYNAEYGNDRYSPCASVFGSVGSPAAVTAKEQYRLYTDRGVYRPAQKVCVAGIVFTQKGDEFNTEYDKKIKVTLSDSRGKTIAENETSSDEFGAFGTEFTLPETTLPGNFRITANNQTSTNIRVEEYKRPTFEVKTDKPSERYAIGDTVSVAGHAVAYSGSGLQGAKVVYEVNRRAFWWFRRDDSRNVIFRDTTATDADGNFTMRIPLTASSTNDYALCHCSLLYTVKASVTSASGETQEAAENIRAGKRDIFIECNLTAKIDKENLPEPVFTMHNLSGEDIQGKGIWALYQGSRLCLEDTFTTNAPVATDKLRALPSGSYTLRTRLADDNDSIYDINRKLLVFSASDTRPADSTEAIRLYSPTDVFDAQGKAFVLIGSSLDKVTAFYDVTANGKLIESRQIELSDSILRLAYNYKEEYGDGISVNLAFMKNGKFYTERLSIAKPRPDKRLRYKWTSFRDRLHPGQSEEWRLQLLNPDGSAAHASAVVAVYDASLDKFADNTWHSAIYIPRHIPSGSWSTFAQKLALYSYQYSINYESCDKLNFDSFSHSIEASRYALGKSSLKVNRAMVLDAAPGKHLKARTSNFAELRGQIAGLPVEETASLTAAQASGDTDAGNEAATPLRENFAETAYFAPTLRSDSNGRISIAFTVPESLTRWNVKLLAHTKAMNIVEADTAATVSKEFTVQPNLPRFVRTGDNATVTATLRNLSDKPLEGRATMTVSNAETLAEISRQNCKFSIGTNGETTVSFTFKADESITSPLLVCSITADAGTFADGERHYIPLLSNMVETLSAEPFTLHGSGTHTIAVADSMTKGRKLTVEYTANPTWLAVQALPAIDKPGFEDALSLTAALYAATIEHEIVSQSPEIRKAAERWSNESDSVSLLANALQRNPDLKTMLLDETPWTVEATGVSRRELARTFDATLSGMRMRNLAERVKLLQLADGGFGWFPGMHSSYYITAEIATMLLRLNALTNNSDMQPAINKATAFLDKLMAEVIAIMKKSERNGHKPDIAYMHLQYLNVMRLQTGKHSATASANIRYLMPLLRKNFPELDISDKATAALVLSNAGYDKEAATALQSILEHTVSDKDKGIWFDSYEAPTYYPCYRIPTQVAALEAVTALKPADKATQNGMLTWLIQSKRTQSWGTVLNTVDATYALLTAARRDSTLLHFATTMPQAMTLTLGSGAAYDLLPKATTSDAETTGYMRADVSDAEAPAAHALNITRSDSGISWGAIYSRGLMPADEVESGGKELTLQREYRVVRNGKEIPLASASNIGIGELVRVRYTINSSRDYDYVSLCDPKPACFEPVSQTSGYRCIGGEWVYLAARDASQCIFLEKLEKGKHVLTLDFRTDRAGSYLAAPATVQCLYSPEFTGRTKAATITVNCEK